MNRLNVNSGNCYRSFTEPTAELIPQPTAELIEKSFAENTVRNRRQALKHFDDWLNGRPCSDGLLAQYITHLFDQGKAPRNNQYRSLRSEVATETPQ